MRLPGGWVFHGARLPCNIVQPCSIRADLCIIGATIAARSSDGQLRLKERPLVHQAVNNVRIRLSVSITASPVLSNFLW
jgi:hypothetical protein